MLWSWLVLRMHRPLGLLGTDEDKHPQMLLVLGLGNLALVGNSNKSGFSPILNKFISTALENHNSLLVELRDEI